MQQPDSLVQRARDFLFRRSAAYRAVFDLSGVYTADVLADLAHFCRANRATGHTDPYVAARLDGRREVWLRIQHQLKLTDDQLWSLYGGEK
ncbi:MAG: hypothetical protein V4641_13040 [Pseudomonadota bacterium]